MRFVVKTPVGSVMSKLAQFRLALSSEQQEILEALGVKVLSFSKQAYIVKSRGGTGSDGIKWKPLAQSTIDARNRRGKRNAKRTTTKSGKARPIGGGVAIGIDTGLQLSSASPGFQAGKGGNIFQIRGASVTVGYGREYSGYFDEQRPLLPAQLPDEWERELNELMVRWAEKLIHKALNP